MPRIVHFEFLAEDPERAAKFWQETFDGNPEGQSYWVDESEASTAGSCAAATSRGQ